MATETEQSMKFNTEPRDDHLSEAPESEYSPNNFNDTNINAASISPQLSSVSSETLVEYSEEETETVTVDGLDNRNESGSPLMRAILTIKLEQSYALDRFLGEASFEGPNPAIERSYCEPEGNESACLNISLGFHAEDLV